MMNGIFKSTNLSPILTSSLILGGLTLVIKVLGYLEKLILAYYFGTGYEIDVYNVVVAIVMSVFIIVREVVEPGFLQAFLKALNLTDHSAAWKLFRVFFRGIGIITLVLTAFCFFFPAQIIDLFAPGFTIEKRTLAMNLLKIVFPASIFLSLTALTNITLNALKQFALPNMGDIILKIFILITLVILYKQLGIYAAGIGFLIGALLKFVFHLIWLYKGLIRQGVADTTLYLRETWKLSWPLLIGVLFSQISTLIDNVFASYQQEGAISALSYAKKLVDLPVLIFPYILSVVVFPYFSELAIAKQKERLSDLLSKALSWITLIFLPLSIYFYLFAYELTALILKRGAFDEHSTVLTALPLKYYAIGMVFFAIETILVIYYFAHSNTKTPIFVGILSVIENIILTIILLRFFGYVGIALALVISKATKNIVLLWLLKDLVTIDVEKVQTFLFKVMITFSLTLGSMLGIRRLIPAWGESTISSISYLAMMMVACAVIYIGGLWVSKFDRKSLW
jgi:putative peptidoglycan lipid II flippase